MDSSESPVHGEQEGASYNGHEPYEYYLAREGKWERRGDTVDIVIAEMADLDVEVADDVRAYLFNLHSYRTVKFGGESPYGPEAMYTEQDPDDFRFHDIWSYFGTASVTSS